MNKPHMIRASAGRPGRAAQAVEVRDAAAPTPATRTTSATPSQSDTTAATISTDKPATGSTRLCLLGPPRVESAGQPRHALERNDAALLALLALDGPAPRSALAALLWPDVPARVARGNLRQRLFRLRAAVGQPLVQGGDMLRLADDITLDISEARAEIARDAAAVQGELLGSLDHDDHTALALWLQAARERWRRTRLDLLGHVASDLERQQRIASALPYAQRLLGEDPLAEHAHRRLMRLHYLRGDRAAALAVYERCHELLGDELGLRPSAETVQLARLIEASGSLPQPAPAPRSVTTLRPPRLLGREAEWQRLSAGGAAFVVGEAGMGKSRLIGDFAVVSAGEGALLSGARPGDARLPYALLARVLRMLVDRFGMPGTAWARRELARVAPELGPLPGGTLDALRMQQAAAEVITERRAGGLTLLALDDLHLADEASLELLPALVEALRAAGLPCLLGARAHEMPVALSAWLQAQDGQALVRIALGPLDLASVQALLESLAVPGLDAQRWAEPMARHTGGNPLFILETLIALLDRQGGVAAAAPPDLPAPAHVGDLIERRLAHLSPSALRLARLAALAGQDFSAELAAQVLGQQPLDVADAWHELDAAGVIQDAAFAHDLLCEATLRSVPKPIARTMHGQVATFLASLGASPARIAAHWYDAEQWAAAGATYERAARQAVAASRPADQASLWDRAVDCHERANDHAAAFGARCASVKAVTAARPLDQAHALTNRLLADARTDPERLDALLERSTLLLLEQEYSDADTLASQARALARQLALPWCEFEAARRLAVSLAQRKRAGEGVELLGGFGAMVEQQGNPTQQHDYWADMAFILNDAGRRRDAADAWRRAAQSAEALGDLHDAVTCSTNLAITMAYSGQPLQAFEQAERARRLRDTLGPSDDLVAGAADMNVASFGLLTGRFDTALACFDSALERFRKGKATAWIAACEHNLAWAWLQLGQTARARQCLTPIGATLQPAIAARRKLVEARIDRALGQTALPRIRAARQLLSDQADSSHHLMAELDESRELLPAEAVAQCRRCQARAEQVELFGLAMKARLFEIEATQRSGDAAAAGDLARAIWELLPACRPVDIYWGEVLWLLARALDAAGDEMATVVLHEGARWLQNEALPHVPETFRDAFLHRHETNRALLALAARRGRH